MAATYTALAQGVTHAASNKQYIQIFATASNTQIIKIRRIWLINAQTATVTGVAVTSTAINIGSFSTAASAGSPVTITPVAHDSTNPAVNANITINHSNTTNGTAVNVFRSIAFSSEETTVGTFKLEEFWSSPNTALIWDAGYGDSNLEPLTIPAGAAGGIAVYGTMTAVGNVDCVVEFTLE
jgi:hypothetical protein